MLPLLISLLAAAGVTALAMVLELIPWWRARTAHWTEQARQLHPPRVAARQFEWGLPLSAALLSRALWPESHWALAAIGAYLGYLVGTVPLLRVLVPGLRLRLWLLYGVHRLVGRFLDWGVLVVALMLMPATAGLGMACIVAGYLAARILLGLGADFVIMRALGLLRPASPRLARVVAEASAATGVASPRTWEMDVPEANAFAVTSTKKLIFTRRLLVAMSDEELCALCRHELAHLAESRGALWLRLLGGSGGLPFIFVRPVYAGYEVPGLLGLVVASFSILWLQARLSQALEKRADREALAPVESTGVYARALETLYRANLTPAVLKGAGLLSHPDLYDRMVAAGVTPAYPRPLSPRNMALSTLPLLVLLAVAGLMALPAR